VQKLDFIIIIIIIYYSNAVSLQLQHKAPDTSRTYKIVLHEILSKDKWGWCDILQHLQFRLKTSELYGNFSLQIFVRNKKSELMLMRRTRAYSSSCSQVILVYLHPFHHNSLFCSQKSPKNH